MTAQRPLSVGILVFDAVEVLDFAGPYEVFTTASRVAGKRTPDAGKLFEVACISRDGQPIQARAGLRVLPEHSFANHLALDLLIVPGGVIDAAMVCPQTLDWLARTAGQAQITASVCTGVFLLAASGVLCSGEVTTHWEDVADLRARFPALTAVDRAHFQTAGEFGDDLFFVAAQFVDVDHRLAKVHTQIAQVCHFVHHGGHVQQCLAGDAADVQADTAQGGVAFHHHDLEADVGGAEGGAVAAGATTQDQQVAVQIGCATKEHPASGLRAFRRPYRYRYSINSCLCRYNDGYRLFLLCNLQLGLQHHCGLHVVSKRYDERITYLML